MNNFELEKLRLSLGSKYRKYSKTGDMKSFLQIAKMFHIPLDIDRIDDYDIVTCDLSNMTVKVVDRKNDTSFVSTCRKDSEFPKNSYGIIVMETSSDSKIKSFYLNNRTFPMVEEVTVEKDDYRIKYRKEHGNFDTKNITTYSVSGDAENETIEYPLFTNEVSKSWSKGKYKGQKSRVLTYGSGYNPFKGTDTKDEEICRTEDNLIYSVNGSNILGNFVKGICFYSADLDDLSKIQYMPSDFEIGYFPELFDFDVFSSMMFDSYNNGTYGSIKVLKKKDNFEVEYGKMSVEEGSITDTGFSFPVLFSGNVTSDEIRVLVEQLKSNYPEAVVSSICEKLSTFADEVEFYSGVKEREDSLMLDSLYEHDIHEVRDFLVSNKDTYFDVMNGKFNDTVSDSKLNREGVMVLAKKSSNN